MSYGIDNYQCYNGRIMRSNKCLSGFYDDGTYPLQSSILQILARLRESSALPRKESSLTNRATSMLITTASIPSYQQCENKVLAPVQHTPSIDPSHTPYSQLAITALQTSLSIVVSAQASVSSHLSSLECSFTGIKCVDSLGDITTSACTDRYVMCDNGKQTAPMPVARISNQLAIDLQLELNATMENKFSSRFVQEELLVWLLISDQISRLQF